jgi:hypothetical protein
VEKVICSQYESDIFSTNSIIGSVKCEATVQRMEELIPADRRIMIDSVETALGCSHGLSTA